MSELNEVGKRRWIPLLPNATTPLDFRELLI